MFSLCKAVNPLSTVLPKYWSGLGGAEMFRNNFHGVLDSQTGGIKRGMKRERMHVKVYARRNSRKGLKFSEGLRKQSARECGMVSAT